MATAFAYIPSTSDGLTVVSASASALQLQYSNAECALEEHAAEHNFGFDSEYCTRCDELSDALDATAAALADAEGEGRADREAEDLYLDGYMSGFAAGYY